MYLYIICVQYVFVENMYKLAQLLVIITFIHSKKSMGPYMYKIKKNQKKNINYRYVIHSMTRTLHRNNKETILWFKSVVLKVGGTASLWAQERSKGTKWYWFEEPSDTGGHHIKIGGDGINNWTIICYTMIL